MGCCPSTTTTHPNDAVGAGQADHDEDGSMAGERYMLPTTAALSLSDVSLTGVSRFHSLRSRLLRIAAKLHCEDSVLAYIDFLRYSRLHQSIAVHADAREPQRITGGRYKRIVQVVRACSQYLVEQYVIKRAPMQLNISDQVRTHVMRSYQQLCGLLHAAMLARYGGDIPAIGANLSYNKSAMLMLDVAPLIKRSIMLAKADGAEVVPLGGTGWSAIVDATSLSIEDRAEVSPGAAYGSAHRHSDSSETNVLIVSSFYGKRTHFRAIYDPTAADAEFATATGSGYRAIAPSMLSHDRQDNRIVSATSFNTEASPSVLPKASSSLATGISRGRGPHRNHARVQHHGEQHAASAFSMAARQTEPFAMNRIDFYPTRTRPIGSAHGDGFEARLQRGSQFDVARGPAQMSPAGRARVAAAVQARLGITSPVLSEADTVKGQGAQNRSSSGDSGAAGSKRPAAPPQAKKKSESVLVQAMQSIGCSDDLSVSGNSGSLLGGISYQGGGSAGLYSLVDIAAARKQADAESLWSQVRACAKMSKQLADESSQVIRKTAGHSTRDLVERPSKRDRCDSSKHLAASNNPSDADIGEGGFLLPSAFEPIQRAAMKVIMQNVWPHFIKHLQEELKAERASTSGSSSGRGMQKKETKGGPSSACAGSEYQAVAGADKKNESNESEPGGQYAVELTMQRAVGPSKTEIVVVGASASACVTAFCLCQNPSFRVTLVCGSRTTMDWHQPSLHGVLPDRARASWFGRLRCPDHAAATVKNGNVMDTSCVGIHSDAIEVGRARIPYDFLVLAPDQAPTVPPEQAARRSWYSLAAKGQQEQQLLRKGLTKSKALLVVGGGAGGIELAIAFKRCFPERQCCLVSRSMELLPRYTRSAQRVQAVGYLCSHRMPPTSSTSTPRIRVRAQSSTVRQGSREAGTSSSAGDSEPSTKQFDGAVFSTARRVIRAVTSEREPYAKHPRLLLEELFVKGGVIPCKVQQKSLRGAAADLTELPVAPLSRAASVQSRVQSVHSSAARWEDSDGTRERLESSVPESMEYSRRLVGNVVGCSQQRRPAIDPAKHAMEALKRHGVEVVMGDPLASWQPSKGGGTTQYGRTITADTVVWAERGNPDTGFAALHLRSRMDEEGMLLVEQDMRVVGLRRVFAAGSCVAIRARQPKYARGKVVEAWGEEADVTSAPRENRSAAGSGKGVFSSTTEAFSPASPSDPNIADCVATRSLQDDVATVLPTKEYKDPFCYAQSQEVGQLARGFPAKCRDAIALNRRERIKAAKTGTKRGFVREEPVLLHFLYQAATVVANVHGAVHGRDPMHRPPLAGLGAPTSVDLGDSGIVLVHGCALPAFDVAATRVSVARRLLGVFSGSEQENANGLMLSRAGSVSATKDCLADRNSCTSSSSMDVSGFGKNVSAVLRQQLPRGASGRSSSSSVADQGSQGGSSSALVDARGSTSGESYGGAGRMGWRGEEHRDAVEDDEDGDCLGDLRLQVAKRSPTPTSRGAWVAVGRS